MKAIVGIYDTRDNALAAIDNLKKAGYTDSNLVLVNKDQLLHNHIHVNATNTVQRAEILVGFVIGLVGGACLGLGFFDLPGLHEVYQQGLLLGAFIGSILGAWISGMIALATAFITNILNNRKYDKQLNEGKFL